MKVKPSEQSELQKAPSCNLGTFAYFGGALLYTCPVIPGQVFTGER